MDFGPVPVRIGAKIPRVSCPDHGVLTARVPWADDGSRFTTDFAFSAAWMLKGGLGRKRISEWLRIDFKTAGRLIKRVWNRLEPDPKVRYNGLVNIGIDETSYRKGHSYITAVVNHDTNTVAWAHDGHGKEIIEKLSEMVRKYKEAGVADDKEIKEEIKREQKRVDEIKQSKYALGKSPENLTKNQQERLELIQAEDPQIKRGHDLKEKLRLILKLKDPELIRIACGFRDIDTMIALIMLFCSSIEIPWPARMTRPPVK